MTKVYGFGWWEPRPKEETLVNRVSGQRVRRVGPVVLEEEPGAQGWLRFEYEDDEVSYPILARLEEGEYSHPFESPYKREGRVLTVDHNYSAALWRREQGVADPYPSYGLWRRVDDCLTDALPCWPRMKSRDRALGQVRVKGGWLNGAWWESFCRDFPALTPLVRKRIAESDHIPRAEQPFIVPLDEKAPPAWQFCPFPPEPADPGKPPPELEPYPRLADRTRVPNRKPGEYHLVVPAEAPLTGIEGRTPYMKTLNGSGLVYATGATSKSQERGQVGFFMEFVDSEIMVNLTATNWSRSSNTTWTFILKALMCGYRRPEVKQSDWIHSGAHGPGDPNLPLYARLKVGLVDSWLFWRGSACRGIDWDPLLAFTSASAVVIRPTYLGGIWSAGEYFEARIE